MPCHAGPAFIPFLPYFPLPIFAPAEILPPWQPSKHPSSGSSNASNSDPSSLFQEELGVPSVNVLSALDQFCWGVDYVALLASVIIPTVIFLKEALCLIQLYIPRF